MKKPKIIAATIKDKIKRIRPKKDKPSLDASPSIENALEAAPVREKEGKDAVGPAPQMPPAPKKKAAVKTVRLYFHAGTQAAIVAYQKSTDKKERERLYVTEIMPAYEKLAENLINIHKFSSLHDTYDDLKNDCVTFLFETIGKFDDTRGTNAFSYFNVVAKNWLIVRTKKKSQSVKRNVSLDNPDALNANEANIIEDHCTVTAQDVLLENYSAAANVVKLLYEIRSKAKTDNELTCINSIITIFENIDDIDLLNKSAILLYMRELSGLTPKQLTTTMQQIKKHYKRLKIDPKFKIW